MTSLPADTLRLSGRGRLVAGAAADIVVFDAATIKDHATYEQPHQYADGMQHVVVNGVVTVRDGTFTGHFGGRALRRSPQTDPTPSSRSERNNVHVID
ncbi:N-acyl-D-aspartate/D-glutamate deacylase [Paenarthrobacter nicotinovorans]|uniref:N-acyl-D-aspartate/D-glutamate deacylase n=1 Tax=Paenarthrobacter nicotinovorans TaxID=29320 RepID=A0ABT9TN90_PAENI|nr:N-acyl-D-aspartate/D-glutamate deacylase [Paenarthrobacter nicotinovorans]